MQSGSGLVHGDGEVVCGGSELLLGGGKLVSDNRDHLLFVRLLINKPLPLLGGNGESLTLSSQSSKLCME